MAESTTGVQAAIVAESVPNRATALASRIISGLQGVSQAEARIIELLPGLPDEHLDAVIAEAQSVHTAAWRIVAAGNAERVRRAWLRSQQTGTSVDALLAEVAREHSTSVRDIRRDKQLYDTFLANSDAASAGSVLADKQYYTVALAAPDPVAALAWMADRKLEDGSYSTRDAEADVRALQAKLLDPASPPEVGESNEWYTPAEYIEAARAVLGAIDLDPASCAEAQTVVSALRYYTRHDDGLRQPWAGRVWLNPPYAYPLVQRFVTRVIQEYETRRIVSAIVLVNTATDTGWFHDLLARYPVCLTRGRVAFWRPDQVGTAPRQGQAVFYLGPDLHQFRDVFRRFGAIVAVAASTCPSCGWDL